MIYYLKLESALKEQESGALWILNLDEGFLYQDTHAVGYLYPITYPTNIMIL